MKEYSIKTGKMEDVPETITNTNTVLNFNYCLCMTRREVAKINDKYICTYCSKPIYQ